MIIQNIENQNRKEYINELRKQIFDIRNNTLQNNQFNLYKESNKYLYWLKENGLIKSPISNKWLQVPEELLNYINKNKEKNNEAL